MNNKSWLKGFFIWGLLSLCVMVKAGEKTYKAKTLHLLADHPSPSLHTFPKPIGIDFILAGLRARRLHIKSGEANTILTTHTIAPYANAIDSMTAQPNLGRKPDETQWQRISCHWQTATPKLSYKTISMDGNSDQVRIFSSMAALYDGKTYRTLEHYRQDDATHASISNSSAGFIPLYSLDPRSIGEFWSSQASDLSTQIQKLQKIARIKIVGSEPICSTPCYRVEVNYSNGDRLLLWLDANHELLIRHSESINKAHTRVFIVDVPSIVSSNNVWMAQNATQSEFVRAYGDDYAKISDQNLEVQNFQANAAVSNAFDLTFPPGTHVDNIIDNTRYIIPSSKHPSSAMSSVKFASASFAMLLVVGMLVSVNRTGTWKPRGLRR